MYKEPSGSFLFMLPRLLIFAVIFEFYRACKQTIASLIPAIYYTCIFLKDKPLFLSVQDFIFGNKPSAIEYFITP